MERELHLVPIAAPRQSSVAALAWAAAALRTVLSPPPALDLAAEPPNLYVVTLKSMILPWIVLLISWSLAGVIVAALGHGVFGASVAGAGFCADLGLQLILRRRLDGAAEVAATLGLRRLRWIVQLRFALAVAGPLGAVWMDAGVASLAVLILMQAWAICVASAQFSGSPTLFRRAISAPMAALALGLAPLYLAPHGVAVALTLTLLCGVTLLVGHESHKIWTSWIVASQHNATLLRQIGAGRDQALRDKDSAEAARQEAADANTAKDRFLATISHEIRTPLNGVMGMAQAMARAPLDEPQRARLDVIRKSGEALMLLLNDVLDMSKIEAGRLELEHIRFDLREVLAGCQATFLGVAQERDLRLVLAIAPAADGGVCGDPGRLRQIVTNLMSNAVKFTARGEITLTADRVDGRLVIAVTDDGDGIPPAAQQAMFETFTQLDASVTRRFGGTGLGLSICRDLTRLMGGDIAVVNAPGRGARFTVSLPLPRVAIEPQGDPAPMPDLPDLPGRLRVLAADDNAVNRLVLEALLAPADIALTMVEDGALALAAWRAEAFDLILMDVQMPVMDGVAALRAIRAQETLTGRPRTPVIALTGDAMAHQVAHLLAAGMDGHVGKPIAVAALFAAMRRALDDKVEPADREARA